MTEAPDPPAPQARSPAQSRPQRRRRQRAPGAYFNLPLWLRFTIAGVIAVVLLTAMVIYVNGHNTNSNPILNEAEQRQANHDAEVLVAQDEAPRTLRISAAEGARPALERVVRARISSLVSSGTVDGPLQSARCHPAGRAAGRVAYSCTVMAANVNYPFVGVAYTGAHVVVYCKQDPPPTPSDSVPVSNRCKL